MDYTMGYLLALLLVGVGFLAFILALIVLEVSKPKFVVSLILSLLLVLAGGYYYYVVMQVEKGVANANIIHGLFSPAAPMVEAPVVPEVPATPAR
ncbi:MAG: hypothetical protein BWY73_00215 [candidate division TA06 bacterium ADurb.Bin417]|uniref:Uncharacterized protein n=1 Tax=candidate division TA06 bacterium ADurb.Bin417 TaxID=1852828 RepID=A0A1V5MK56_UNCT6|nr:MAG: hypothetical protein BWY73_00215 [candidate division TA06 bacterium ADurb.Bin417]